LLSLAEEREEEYEGMAFPECGGGVGPSLVEELESIDVDSVGVVMLERRLLISSSCESNEEVEYSGDCSL